MNSLGKWLFDEEVKQPFSPELYWLSEGVSSKNAGISVGRAERFRSPQSGRLERGGMRSKESGDFGRFLYLEHLFQVEAI